MKNKIKSIVIIGRRWFHRGSGNTYHSFTALDDGKEVARENFAYGYGNQYEWNAQCALDRAGLLPGLKRFDNGSTESMYTYCERNGIAYHSQVVDVQRKKDL